MHNDDNAKQKQNLHGKGNRAANQQINQTNAVPKHRSSRRRTETNEIKADAKPQPTGDEAGTRLK